MTWRFYSFLACEFFFLVVSFKNRKLTKPLFMENCGFKQCYLSNGTPTSMITKHSKSIDNGNQQNTMTPDLLGGLGDEPERFAGKHGLLQEAAGEQAAAGTALGSIAQRQQGSTMGSAVGVVEGLAVAGFGSWLGMLRPSALGLNSSGRCLSMFLSRHPGKKYERKAGRCACPALFLEITCFYR